MPELFNNIFSKPCFLFKQDSLLSLKVVVAYEIIKSAVTYQSTVENPNLNISLAEEERRLVVR